MLKFKEPWGGTELDAYFKKDTYCFKKQNRMYLGMLTIDPDFGFLEPFCDVTVNLPREMLTGKNCAFVDTNNAPFLPRFLVENGLAEPTGNFGFSGYCAYPEYRFNMEEINKHLPQEG